MHKMYKIPTREECQEICQSSDAFYCKEGTFKNIPYELYNYRLASYSDFCTPQRLEMRGLMFLFIDNEWIPNIGLHKFFNINENPYTMIENLKEFSVERINDKADGSLIIPFIINGEIHLRTKMSLESEQAEAAQKLLNGSKDLQDFIWYCIRKGHQPLFEYTSPFNQIVLNYSESDLRLLQVRDSEGNYVTEEYLDSEELMTLEDLQMMQETVKGIEGWVVQLSNSQFVKAKTKDYFEKHGLVSEGTRENLLIQSIMSESIDDIISMLPEGQKRDFIVSTTEKVQHKYDKMVKEALRLLEIAGTMERKEFAKEYNSSEVFSVVMKSLQCPDNLEHLENNLKNYILRSTSRLGDARKFIESI